MSKTFAGALGRQSVGGQATEAGTATPAKPLIAKKRGRRFQTRLDINWNQSGTGYRNARESELLYSAKTKTRFQTREVKRGWQCVRCESVQQLALDVAHFVERTWVCACCKNKHIEHEDALRDGEFDTFKCQTCGREDVLCVCGRSDAAANMTDRSHCRVETPAKPVATNVSVVVPTWTGVVVTSEAVPTVKWVKPEIMPRKTPDWYSSWAAPSVGTSRHVFRDIISRYTARGKAMLAASQKAKLTVASIPVEKTIVTKNPFSALNFGFEAEEECFKCPGCGAKEESHCDCCSCCEKPVCERVQSQGLIPFFGVTEVCTPPALSSEDARVLPPGEKVDVMSFFSVKTDVCALFRPFLRKMTVTPPVSAELPPLPVQTVEERLVLRETREDSCGCRCEAGEYTICGRHGGRPARTGVNRPMSQVKVTRTTPVIRIPDRVRARIEDTVAIKAYAREWTEKAEQSACRNRVAARSRDSQRIQWEAASWSRLANRRPAILIQAEKAAYSAPVEAALNETCPMATKKTFAWVKDWAIRSARRERESRKALAFARIRTNVMRKESFAKGIKLGTQIPSWKLHDDNPFQDVGSDEGTVPGWVCRGGETRRWFADRARPGWSFWQRKRTNAYFQSRVERKIELEECRVQQQRRNAKNLMYRRKAIKFIFNFRKTFLACVRSGGPRVGGVIRDDCYTGRFCPALAPGTPGYCWLSCFPVEEWEELVDLLGPYPRLAKLFWVMRGRPQSVLTPTLTRKPNSNVWHVSEVKNRVSGTAFGGFEESILHALLEDSHGFACWRVGAESGQEVSGVKGADVSYMQMIQLGLQMLDNGADEDPKAAEFASAIRQLLADSKQSAAQLAKLDKEVASRHLEAREPSKSTCQAQDLMLPVMEVTEAGFFYRLTGHYLSVAIGGRDIVAQGKTWTRYANDDGTPDLMLTNRGRPFWEHPVGLKLTIKGFIRLYRSKLKKWRKIMARQLEMDHQVLEECILSAEFDPYGPDVEPISPRKVPIPVELKVVKNVVVEEVHVVEKYTKGVQPSPMMAPVSLPPVPPVPQLTTTSPPMPPVPPPPPPPPLQVAQVGPMPEVAVDWGEDFPTARDMIDMEGINMNGKSLRARYRHTYHSDWQMKIGQNLYNRMIADLDPDQRVLARAQYPFGQPQNPRAKNALGFTAPMVFGEKLRFENEPSKSSMADQLKYMRDKISRGKGRQKQAPRPKADNEGLVGIETNPGPISPIGELDYQPPRKEAFIVNGVMLTLRHPQQDKDIRALSNSGPHGLPGSFLDNYPRLPNEVFSEVSAYCAMIIETIREWDFKGGHIYVSANLDFDPPGPTVNLITDSEVRLSRRADNGVDIHVPLKGMALRSLRLLPLFTTARVEVVTIINGRSSDYVGGLPRIFDSIPFPQVNSFYFDLAYAGASSFASGHYMGNQKALEYLINTCTVYGSEEFLMSQEPWHHIASPRRELSQLPGALCPGVVLSHRRYYYDSHGNLIYDTKGETLDVKRLQSIRRLLYSRGIENNLDGQVELSFDSFKNTLATTLYKGWFIITTTVTMALAIVFRNTTTTVQFSVGLFLITSSVVAFGYWLIINTLSKIVFKPSMGHQVIHGPKEFPEGDPSEYLSIPTMGTRGDHVPLRFFGFLAMWLGVKVHMQTLQTASHRDLAELKQGKLWSLVPGYMANHFSRYLGFKAIFCPHVDLGLPNATSYTMAPPFRYIEPIRYLTDENKTTVPWINKVADWFAQQLALEFKPDWRIGCLKGCNLPRSLDGIRLVEKRTNFNTGKTGWLSGSADPMTIPEEIRTTYERVPDGDHNEIFRHYDTIYMTGGAGAVQTAIACGCRPIVLDQSLDRIYHTMPTQKDFYQPSVLPYLGWLVKMGFKMTCPEWLTYVFLLSYYSTQLHVILPFTLHVLFRIVLFVIFGANHFLFYFALFLSFPTFINRNIRQFILRRDFMKMALGALWKWPVVLIAPSWVVTCSALVICYTWWWQLTQDGLNMYTQRFEIVWEPVTRGKFTFPFPWGHWLLRSNETNTIYEGKFVGTHEIGQPFRLEQVKRELHPGHISFPCPFHEIYLLKGQEERPYGPSHNCTTVLLQGVWHRSAIWSFLLFLVIQGTWLVLKPPSSFKTIYDRIFPESDYTKTWVYQAMGFAGAGDIPLEHEENRIQEEENNQPSPVDGPETAVESHNSPHSSQEQELAYYTSEQSESDAMDALIDGLQFLSKEMEEDDAVEVITSAYEKMLVDPDNKIPMPFRLEMPKWRPSKWDDVVDMFYAGLREVADSRLVATFINWLEGLADNFLHFLQPLLLILEKCMHLALEIGLPSVQRVYNSLCALLDWAWGKSDATRVKTVWGLTGLYKSGLTSKKARMVQWMQHMEHDKRGQFLDDYEEFVEGVKKHSQHLADLRLIGGPQRRKVGYGKPVMSRACAKALGMDETEFVVDEDFERRIQEYIKEGVPQGMDGVFFADKNPDRLAKSIRRYEPQYSPITSEERALVRSVAEALFNEHPEVFADADIMPCEGINSYIKVKYSPGSPFINGGYNSRRALQESGIMQVILDRAQEALNTGIYPNQFYHAFAKAQVVNMEKLFPPVCKDLRTVVSQDLLSYFVDQIFQIERTKRINWKTYGTGAGMPLGQPMSWIFDQFRDLQLQEGGQFIIADAKAFDSKCKPVLFEAAAILWELGFKDHKLNTDGHFSSVLRAKYDAMQNGWIFGITEPEYDSLTICVPDRESRAQLHKGDPTTYVLFRDFLKYNNIDPIEFNKKSHDEQLVICSPLKVPHGKVLLTPHPAFQILDSSWQGVFSLEENKGQYSRYQVFHYQDPKNLRVDVTRLAHSSRALLTNVHAKNRGGGTGQSNTSGDNNVLFRVGMISAWCRATGKTPQMFFRENKLYNTSDDTVWWSKAMTTEQIDAFKIAAKDFGIILELGTTKKITECEYLSKLPRIPTPEDTEDYKEWRRERMRQIEMAQNWTQGQIDQFKENKMPRYFIVQNPAAILLRRTEFRYYQSSIHRYLLTDIERGAGHALVTAFQPTLYKRFAVEWCESMNKLCRQNNINQKWQLVGQYSPSNGKRQLINDRIDCRVENTNPNWKVNFKSSSRQEAFLAWQKQNKFPSYRQVLAIHMREKDPDPLAHEKFIAKLDKAWRGNDQIFAEAMDGLALLTDYIPEEFRKFTPGVDMLYAEVPWTTHHQYIEKFTYLKMLEEGLLPEEITLQVFDARLRESPYGVCINAVKFYDDLKDAQYQAALLDSNVTQYQGLVLLISILYFSMRPVEIMLQAVPFIGPLYNLFMWSFWGLNKVYGLANTTYWHGKAKSSREISSMLPRDPYKWSKRACVSIVDFVPERAGYIFLPFLLLLDMISGLIEIIFGRWWRAGTEIKNTGEANSAPNNPWQPYAHTYLEQLKKCEYGVSCDGKCGHCHTEVPRITVAAKTATGKSTFLLAALHSERKNYNVKHIWLLVPRKILRNEWSIPFKIRSQKLMRSVVRDPTATIYITTYGHFLNRLPDLNPASDLVIFDEFHERDGFMLQGLERWQGRTILLSATPVLMPGMGEIKMNNPNIPRRFDITVYETNTEDLTTMWTQARNQYPDDKEGLFDRPLFIVPTYRELERTIEAMRYIAPEFTWVEVSARSPKIPEGDKGVGIIATPYVQTGLDIKPAPTILFDSGRDVKIHKGAKMTPNPPTDPKTNEQRIGRVGRLKAGVVYQPKCAGTGPEAVIYPSGVHFFSRMVSEFYKVPRLTETSKTITRQKQNLPPDVMLLPFLSFSAACSPSEAKSLLFIHALALFGVAKTDWEMYYSRYFELHLPLSEDMDIIEKVMNQPGFMLQPPLPWSVACQTLYEGKVTWGIAGHDIVTMPLYPQDGKWVADPKSNFNDHASKRQAQLDASDPIDVWRKEVEKYSKENRSLRDKLQRVENKVMSLLPSLEQLQCAKTKQHQLKAQMSKVVKELEVRHGQRTIVPVLETHFNEALQPVFRQKGSVLTETGSACSQCRSEVAHHHNPGTYAQKGYEGYRDLKWVFKKQ